MAEKENKNKINKDVKKIVIARLEVFPADKKISIGSKGEFTKKEMIDHVEKEDEIGEKIAEVQLNYLQALKEGIFYEQDSINNTTKT
jgi:hypothetical protein